MTTGRTIAATYPYADETEAVLYEVVRYEPKGFSQRMPARNGQYEYRLNGVRRVPYRLKELLRRKALETVFVAEGEKDADALRSLGFCATTSAQGTGWKWTADFVEYFRGAKRVVVIADSDEPGRQAASTRNTLVANVVGDTRCIDLAPSRNDGYDVSDWIAEGHTAADLRALVEAAPSSELVALEPELEWDDARPWPLIDSTALHGLAGEFVRLVAPHSEADLAALLSQFLCVFGCAIGPSAHVMVEATQHTGRINVLVIGETAGGRKGTAKDQVYRLFRIADASWLEAAVVSGLASGEGLIARLKDREDEPLEKRVIVIEPEFARTLAAASRDGSILGAIIRDAWDSGRLQNLTKKEPQIAKGCHVSIIGHITADELREKLSSTDIANGFYNRFVSVCARRRQRLPHGGALVDADLAPIAKRLRTALDFARQVGSMRRTAAANTAWEKFYNAVPEPQGLLGAATARAEAQVLRMSLLYALLDGSAMVDEPHLRAAIALWNYAYATADYVFGSALGDNVADRVLAELRATYPGTCDRKELHGLFSGHQSAARLSTAIDHLVRKGLATIERVKTDGRPKERIRALAREKRELSERSPHGDPLSSLNSLNSHSRETVREVVLDGEPLDGFDL